VVFDGDSMNRSYEYEIIKDRRKYNCDTKTVLCLKYSLVLRKLLNNYGIY